MAVEASEALSIACLTSFDAPGLERDWDALARRLAALPFMTYSWSHAWWQSLRRTSLLTRDSLRLFTIRNAQGALVAVAPMMLTERLVIGLPIARTLQFIGADPNITEVRGMLVAPVDEQRVVELLRQELALRAEYDRLIWSGLQADGAAVVALQAEQGSRLMPHVSMLVVELPDSWDAFKATLPRNTREALRKCYNSLARDGHSATLTVHTSHDAIRQALPRFFELHSSRAAVQDGVHHYDCFAGSDARAFVRGIVDDVAPTGTMRMFELEIGGVVVAARLAFMYGNGIYLYYAGYDPGWGRYSVMTTLVAEILKHSMEQGLRFANLSTGIDRSKMRWRPAETRFETLLVAANTSRASVALRVEALTTRGRMLRGRLARLFNGRVVARPEAQRESA